MRALLVALALALGLPEAPERDDAALVEALVDDLLEADRLDALIAHGWAPCCAPPTPQTTAATAAEGSTP